MPTTMELVLTFLFKLSNAAGPISVLGILGFLAGLITYFACRYSATEAESRAASYNNEKNSHRYDEHIKEASGYRAISATAAKTVKVAIGALVIGSLLSSVPSPDELWKTRIAFIKLYLASPDNLQKGVETIERVAKKLECRYVGGPECKGEK